MTKRAISGLSLSPLIRMSRTRLTADNIDTARLILLLEWPSLRLPSSSGIRVSLAVSDEARKVGWVKGCRARCMVVVAHVAVAV